MRTLTGAVIQLMGLADGWSRWRHSSVLHLWIKLWKLWIVVGSCVVLDVPRPEGAPSSAEACLNAC